MAATSATTTRIGDFELLGKLGQGGMGAVYKARQASLDRLVALKILDPKLVNSDPVFVERFLNEARATAKLNHPNIVAGYAVGSAEGYHYFAMEFIQGENLKTRIIREGVLAEAEVLRIGAAISAALGHAHAAKIVHRDVKPDNILIDADGTPKLADLGLAKGARREDASLTQSGSTVGTPHYIAPEQARGERDIDGRADQYGLGCTLYHAASGRTPFDAPTAPVLMVKHINEKMPHPRSFRPDLSDGCCAVIGRMVARDAADRYALMEEAAEDLQRVLNGEEPLHAALPASKLNFLPVRGGGRQATSRNIKAVDRDGSSRGIRVGELERGGTSRSLPIVGASRQPERRGTHAREQPVGKLPLPVLAGIGGGVLLVLALVFALSGGNSQPPAKKEAVEARPSPSLKSTLQTPLVPPAPSAFPSERPPAPKPDRLVEAATSSEDPFVVAIAALPPQEQVRQVMDALKKANPGFDGKYEHKIENGRVTELFFLNTKVSDISPLRALRGLRGLKMDRDESKGQSPLADVSPLRGLPLEELCLDFTSVTDLSPLQGMPLQKLYLDGCRVLADLRPLAGLPLTVLQVSWSRVASLEPLRGMKLQRLRADGSQVRDLAPLQSMPLQTLFIDNLKIEDKSILSTLPLKNLRLEFVAEKDWAILKAKSTLEHINNEPADKFLAARAPATGGTEAGFTSLFNGRDMTGWKVQQGKAADWTIRDGALCGKSPGALELTFVQANRVLPSNFELCLTVSASGRYHIGWDVMPNEETYYLHHDDDGSFRLKHYRKEKSIPLVQSKAKVTGGTYRWCVRHHDGTVKVEVNGTEVIQYKGVLKGSVHGSFHLNVNDGNAALFRDIRARALAANESAAISIFNGADWSEWRPGDAGAVWRVVDGKLAGWEKPNNCSLICRKPVPSDFEFSFKATLGVIKVGWAPEHEDKANFFYIERDNLLRLTNFTSGDREADDLVKDRISIKGDEVQVRIEVRGSKAKVEVDGKLVAESDKCVSTTKPRELSIWTRGPNPSKYWDLKLRDLTAK